MLPQKRGSHVSLLLKPPMRDPGNREEEKRRRRRRSPRSLGSSSRLYPTSEEKPTHSFPGPLFGCFASPLCRTRRVTPPPLSTAPRRTGGGTDRGACKKGGRRRVFVPGGPLASTPGDGDGGLPPSSSSVTARSGVVASAKEERIQRERGRRGKKRGRKGLSRTSEGRGAWKEGGEEEAFFLSPKKRSSKRETGRRRRRRQEDRDRLRGKEGGATESPSSVFERGSSRSVACQRGKRESLDASRADGPLPTHPEKRERRFGGSSLSR